LRAYWLSPPCPEQAAPFVAITVERREPRSLALLKKIEVLNLSDREKQLCLLLARGYDTANAAIAMGVRDHTVITHRRNLYNKLGIAGRIALLDRLRCN
jgi:DNA-binding CsgD family transcriptional regulator